MRMIVPSAALLLVLGACSASAAVSVRDFGATGDGSADDSEAFRKALAATAGEVLVPPGTYLIGDVAVPDGRMIRGEGVASIIRCQPQAEAALVLGNDCTVRDLKVVGTEGDTSNGITKGLLRTVWTRGTVFRGLVIEGTTRSGILTDHGSYLRIADCRFAKVGIAAHLVFSHHAVVSGNLVEEASLHGFQFWGNWEFRDKGCSDLTFTGNVVRKAAGGGIWGTGASRVTFSGNVVDGAGDVGLDFEWCDDSTMTGNTVRAADNAGLSLFYSCHNITLSGNTVVITDGEPGLRLGIWLTDPNTQQFPGDVGHRLISIVGNTIRAEGAARHGIQIGVGTTQLGLSTNLLENADILDLSGATAAPANP